MLLMSILLGGCPGLGNVTLHVSLFSHKQAHVQIAVSAGLLCWL